MLRTDFTYELPEDLIAQFPSAERGDSRLLCLNGKDGALNDRKFSELTMLLRPNDLLVFNDTRVIPARLFGHKETGGRIEIMIERMLGDQQILAQVRASKPPRPGSYIILERGIKLELIARREDMFVLGFEGGQKTMEILNDIGHMPIPPYIQRADERIDKERYQTIYAQKTGAVAAPTAGLHFTEEILKQFTDRKIDTVYVTLHIGAGTFQPVRTDNIEDHRMHSEYLEVSAEACEKVNATKKQGGRIIAVGTTSVRCLEMAANSGSLNPYKGETDIFIYPGFKFQIVDFLITNFHLPESTLLMLVCAFAGREHVLSAYQHAIARKYRFYSYGDAMFITKREM
ncbi:MAG: tRNA preQ1(34) S-adenosylmethionine ribosyltransferase-isomerase QueA [Gammaproteobacteria bacterium]|nr:tRNA preQ1(34) S-adenosylmethionine ribosyltransferase-isomerase QueA [Gammaproteobacteria bacterium]